MKVCLINLKQDKARLQHMQKQLKSLGIKFERIDAVMGSALPEEERARFNSYQTAKKTEWSNGQIGCFKSHQAAWKAIAESNEDFGLVLEDDMHLSPDVRDMVNDSSWVPAGVDIVRLEVSTNAVRMSKRASSTIKFGSVERSTYRLDSAAWCTGAYIIPKASAKKLLGFGHELATSVDAFMFDVDNSPVARMLKTHQMDPAPAIQDKYNEENVQGFGSNIEFHVASQKPKKVPFYQPYVSAIRKGSSPLTKAKKVILGYKRIKHA